MREAFGGAFTIKLMFIFLKFSINENMQYDKIQQKTIN